MKVIVFEGLDRSGKTTLCREFAKATEQLYTCLDRWVTSCRVYDRFFGRHQDDEKLEAWRSSLEQTLIDNFDLTVIFVDTPPEVCRQRGAQYNEKQLCEQRELYLDELQKLRERGASVAVLQTCSGDLVHTIEELVISCRNVLNI